MRTECQNQIWPRAASRDFGERAMQWSRFSKTKATTGLLKIASRENSKFATFDERRVRVSIARFEDREMNESTDTRRVTRSR